jgi:predicted RNA-binding protein YlqC (UPF0109 family)
MKELLEAIAKALVDNPDQVQVRAIEGEALTVLELRVHPSDLGIVIGRQGRMATAIRTILGAAGVKLRKRIRVEILE